MSKKYQEYQGLNLPNVAKDVLERWEELQIFEKSISTRDDNKKMFLGYTGLSVGYQFNDENVDLSNL